MADSGPLNRALAEIDRALAARSRQDAEALAAALRAVAALRDESIARLRRGEPAFDLGTLNAAISALMAAAYPLGPVPWDELEAARGQLAALDAK